MPIHDWTRVNAGIFHDFHLSWIYWIRDALNNGILPADYYALAEQQAERKQPDVLTLRRSEEQDDPGSNGSHAAGTSPAAVLTVQEAPPSVAFEEDLDDEFYVSKRRTIAIRHVSGDELVALVEIMSPGNKSSKSHVEQFLEKIVMAIQAGIHVLIVDLHPPTPRDPRGIHGAIAAALGREQTRFDPQNPLTLVAYCASGATRAYVQPVAVGGELSSMPLFLSEYEYVNVPLSDTYSSAFRRLPRHLRAMLDSPD
jgi:hypothetical protein